MHKSHKTNGRDGITPRVLKELADPVANIYLTVIVRKSSLTSVRYLTIGKSLNVTAVSKKGSKWNPNNYDLISLMCTACKIMGHIITNSLPTIA